GRRDRDLPGRRHGHDRLRLPAPGRPEGRPPRRQVRLGRRPALARPPGGRRGRRGRRGWRRRRGRL
ncbi:MAG: hypothetical protein AVDCRST_MAG41-1028, partial [uncultured Corynebacteriales bacterium]